MAIMPASGRARMAGLRLDGKRIATATIRLPERWREAVMKGESGFTDFTPVQRRRCGARTSADESAPGEGVDLAAYRSALERAARMPQKSRRWSNRVC